MAYCLIEEGDTTVLVLDGEVDLHFSTTLRKLILTIMDKKQPFNIDLHNVEYLDSSGVACFVEALQLSKNNEVDFKLVNVGDDVMQVFKLARLDQIFPIA